MELAGIGLGEMLRDFRYGVNGDYDETCPVKAILFVNVDNQEERREER